MGNLYGFCCCKRTGALSWNCYAIIGVPLIIAGLRLTGAVDSMKEFSYANDVNKLSDMVDKLNTYFRIYGILTLIGLLVGLYH